MRISDWSSDVCSCDLRSRLVDCRRRMNLLPLGAAALAGTVYPIDRHYVAELLGFDGVTENSLDTVSDRDFAIEFCAAASLILIHLSRWSEELILWSTPMFGRSEERRVGKECVSTCRSGWSPYH